MKIYNQNLSNSRWKRDMLQTGSQMRKEERSRMGRICRIG
jgi:hypothetical protein